MDIKKIEQLAELLTGLKQYEWSRLKIAIEQLYSEASSGMELPNANAVQSRLNLEFKGFID